VPIRNPAALEAERQAARQAIAANFENPLPPPPKRLMVGTLAYSEDLAGKRKAEYVHASAAGIRHAIECAKAHMDALRTLDTARQAFLRRIREQEVVDRAFVDALVAIGVDYDQAKLTYDAPLSDANALTLYHSLLDHNDVLARACGYGTLEDYLSAAEQREAGAPVPVVPPGVDPLAGQKLARAQDWGPK
jgi:hypothetical protein